MITPRKQHYVAQGYLGEGKTMDDYRALKSITIKNKLPIPQHKKFDLQTCYQKNNNLCSRY